MVRGKNDIEMYSTRNEGKSVVAENLLMHECMNATHECCVKNIYVDKLNDIVDEYNNTCHKTIKTKPVDVKDNTYIRKCII